MDAAFFHEGAEKLRPAGRAPGGYSSFQVQI
jgi:hypothetical protein